MAKGRGSNVTVMTGKTLENLINLQMSTQDVLAKISESMKDAADRKSDSVQTQLLGIQQKLLDVNLDNFKLNKKTSETQSKTFEDLSKGLKDWQTWGDKLKDLKSSIVDKASPESIQKKLLKGLNIGGVLNKQLLALDFKKVMKATGEDKGLSKKELNERANQAADAQIAMMRENAKFERLKKRTGKDEDFLKDTNKGKEILDERNKQAGILEGLFKSNQKSPKDIRNKMGGNAGGISVPLSPAEAQPLDVSSAGKEGQLEQAQLAGIQTELLQQIAKNTGIMAGIDQQGNKKTDDDGKNNKGLLGGLLDGVMALFGEGFLTAVRSVFSVKAIMRVITKFFAPAMLIGSLVNGIMDGFNAWKETGSISEALIAGLGGIVEFLSFGLFDKDTIKNIVNTVSGFVDKYITQPIADFANGLGEAFDTYIAQPIKQAFDSMLEWAQGLYQLFQDYVINPIQTALQPLQEFFSDMIDTVLTFLKNIEIPGISFTIPVVDKDVSFGPWKPFDVNENQADKVAAQSAPTSGQIVMSASKNNADTQAAVEGQSNVPQQANVSAAVQNNTTNNQIIKMPARNQESSQSKYLAARY